MFRTGFEKNLDTATTHLQLEPHWPSIMLICDAINQKDTSPKAAFAAIKKKMTNQNPHTAYYALLVLESVVKNCGAPVHDEVFTKENCTMFSQFLESTTHENVRAKMLELVQTWSFAFRNSDKYQAIKHNEEAQLVDIAKYEIKQLRNNYVATNNKVLTADNTVCWQKQTATIRIAAATE